jgi:hypothetical protein
MVREGEHLRESLHTLWGRWKDAERPSQEE